MNSDNQSLMCSRSQSIKQMADQTAGHIFYGWRMVLVSAIGLFWGIPIAVYSFSVFFKPGLILV